jgi:predicted nucleic acid-binding protein
MAILVDAGPLVAYVDADEEFHAASLELLQAHPGPLIVPVLVVTEVLHVIASRLGTEAELRFLADLASGPFVLEEVAAADWQRIAELVWRYRELHLGTVDASVIAAAERLGLGTIATLDRRHFGVVVPLHVSGFELLPERDDR